jgi:cellulose synthase/poly-beta-1,6-N-acetylglucosamine synthase-like glycosyltransferase
MILVYFLCVLYGVAMSFILVYGVAQGHLLYHFLKAEKTRDNTPPKTPEVWPRVTVQLPVFNELYVVERLIDAVASLNYPAGLLQIQILDDSTDQTTELIKNKLREYPQIDFQYLHREDRKGFKAGALREGLEQATGEFVAIFDADFVPDPDFLLHTIPYFTTEKIGMVQTRWTHLNRNYSLLTRLQAVALDTHFLLEQSGRSHQGAFINFNGTGGIWRKSCIYDAGNWEDDTLTEDLDLSYRAQRKGWKFVYRPEIESPAELPPIMSAVKSQQFRWTKGGAECAMKHYGEMKEEDLPFRIKFHSFAHLFNSLIFIAVFVSSLSSIGVWWAAEKELIPMVWMQVSAIFLVGFVLIAGTYLVCFFFEGRSFLKSALCAIWQLPLFMSVSMGLSLHNSQAVWEGLTGKKSPFVRTPKFNLGSGSGNLFHNRYLIHRMPLTTWMEGCLALIFWGMVALAFQREHFLFLPFHAMLAFGYSLVFVKSLKSYGFGR